MHSLQSFIHFSIFSCLTNCTKRQVIFLHFLSTFKIQPKRCLYKKHQWDSDPEAHFPDLMPEQIHPSEPACCPANERQTQQSGFSDPPFSVNGLPLVQSEQDPCQKADCKYIYGKSLIHTGHDVFHPNACSFMLCSDTTLFSSSMSSNAASILSE